MTTPEPIGKPNAAGTPNPTGSSRAELGGVRRLPRIDPKGKHALFSTPVQAAPDQLRAGNQKEGKHALYSTGPRQAGTVIIDCSSCEVRSRSSLVDLGVRIASISLWFPGRKHSHWLRCPACHHHTWCRIGWTE